MNIKQRTRGYQRRGEEGERRERGAIVRRAGGCDTAGSLQSNRSAQMCKSLAGAVVRFLDQAAACEMHPYTHIRAFSLSLPLAFSQSAALKLVASAGTVSGGRLRARSVADRSLFQQQQERLTRPIPCGPLAGRGDTLILILL